MLWKETADYVQPRFNMMGEMFTPMFPNAIRTAAKTFPAGTG